MWNCTLTSGQFEDLSLQMIMHCGERVLEIQPEFKCKANVKLQICLTNLNCSYQSPESGTKTQNGSSPLTDFRIPNIP